MAKQEDGKNLVAESADAPSTRVCVVTREHDHPSARLSSTVIARIEGIVRMQALSGKAE
jgi:hypothetical protein